MLIEGIRCKFRGNKGVCPKWYAPCSLLLFPFQQISKQDKQTVDAKLDRNDGKEIKCDFFSSNIFVKIQKKNF